MKIPIPGKPVRGSRSGAPIMALFDLLGRRWAMGVLWKLSAEPAGFRDLQARCESISPTILNRRLKELRQAKLIDRCPRGYCLTPLGAELYGLLEPLGALARRWGEALAEETCEGGP